MIDNNGKSGKKLDIKSFFKGKTRNSFYRKNEAGNSFYEIIYRMHWVHVT